MINIKDVLFCEYMSDMSVCIEDVEVWLSFFISQSACQCTLDQSFEAVIQMIYIIKKNASVWMTVLNDQENYTVFQLYTSENEDQYDYKIV